MLVEEAAHVDHQNVSTGRQTPCPAQPSPAMTFRSLSRPVMGGRVPIIQSLTPPHRTDLISACSTFVQLPPSNEMTQWSTPPLQQHRGATARNATHRTTAQHSTCICMRGISGRPDRQTDKQSERQAQAQAQRQTQETPARDPGPGTQDTQLTAAVGDQAQQALSPQPQIQIPREWWLAAKGLPSSQLFSLGRNELLATTLPCPALRCMLPPELILPVSATRAPPALNRLAGRLG